MGRDPYHFGDRLGLLLATFDLTIDRYVERLDTWSFDGTISERCGTLVDGLWSQMATRTPLEISSTCTDTLRPVGHPRAPGAPLRSRDLWQRTFPDIDQARVGRVRMVMPSLRVRGRRRSAAQPPPADGLLADAARRLSPPGTS